MKAFLLFLIVCLSGLLSYGQTLGDYFMEAVESNPGLQSKYKTFEAALQKVPQAGAFSDPTLSVGYFISPVETRVGPQLVRFSLSQMFPWFGTQEAQRNVAALNAESHYQTFVDARNNLYMQLAEAYYPLYELERWVELEEENLRVLETFKTLATKKFEQGRALTNVLRADLIIAERQTNLGLLIEKREPLLSAFNSIMNRLKDQGIALPDSLPTPSSLAVSPVDSLLNGHPAIQEIELRRQALEATKTVTQKQSLPRLGLGLDYVAVGERRDMEVTDNGKDILMPMATLSLPLFRNKYDGAIQEINRLEEGEQFRKEDVENRLVRRYDQARYELQKQQTLFDLYEAQVTRSQQIQDLLTRSYAQDDGDFEEILQIQMQLLQYQKMKVSALTQYHIAMAQLEYIVGIER